MDQYKKSSVVKKLTDTDHQNKTQNLQIQKEFNDLRISNNELREIIDSLQKEIRKIKVKLDAHAQVINQMRKNG